MPFPLIVPLLNYAFSTAELRTLTAFLYRISTDAPPLLAHLRPSNHTSTAPHLRTFTPISAHDLALSY